ncbi:major capsid protein [Capybara microvirus Cap1_SP_200]|nr:major capsid protein [Capybara microvirus Cap1_SP_200]
MQHLFSQIPKADIQRSSFDRSHGYKTCFDSGYLVPFFVDEVLPGDTFNLQATILARLSTPIVPIMDNLFLDTFFFFVPNRLVWDNWQKFMGEQVNPEDTIDYLVPTIQAPSGGFEVGSVADYFGIPTGVPNIKVNALPFRAYNKIFQEWFKCEYLQPAPPLNHGDGPDDPADYSLLRRCKRPDFFTSSLPYPQKFSSPNVPIYGETVPVIYDAKTSSITFDQSASIFRGTYDDGHYVKYSGLYFPSTSDGVSLPFAFTGPSTFDSGVDNVAYNKSYGLTNISGGSVDLSQAAAININTIRQAFAIQRLLERDARGGTRYTEILRSHFGVISPDARLQRPEYLGGSSSLINVHPVQQTSASNDVTPQGNLAAFGVCGDKVHGFTHSFVEHGFIIGLVNVRADLTYQQGLNKMWSRTTRFSYYWPSLAHLSEQPVLNKEIYAQGNEQDEQVFGYQEAFAEYRYYPSLVTSKLRSTANESLDVWHLSQKFESLPLLNADFIQDNPPLARALAVQNEPQFIMDTYFKMSCVRPMPLYGVPGLIDHF